ncbi:hypothetical protein, partial [Fulvivirga kasyanovii]|uniref:hypothetical protein n=1 Tax=Fulvivirga kasyanovii TaxID=396812 RepID=UPI0031E42CA7
ASLVSLRLLNNSSSSAAVSLSNLPVNSIVFGFVVKVSLVFPKWSFKWYWYTQLSVVSSFTILPSSCWISWRVSFS